jgi:hypothetical protein
MAGHLPHGDRVAGDQADQAAPGLLPRLRIKSQRDVEVQLPEPHQPGAASRLLDQGAELLIRRTGLKVAEQRPDVRPADAAEDTVQHAGERPFAFDDVPANRNLKHMLGGHGLPFLSPAWAVPLRDHAGLAALWSLPMRQTQERHQVTLPPQATCSRAFESATASQKQGGT